MWGVSVAVSVVVAAAVVPCLRASAARPGLSWCSESTLDNFRITKEMKPELGMIGVVVNDIYETDVVDEVFIRQQLPCEGINQEEVALLDRENAELMMQDGEISLFWKPPDAMPIFQEVKDFCITVNRDGHEEDQWQTFLAKFCFPRPLLQTEKELEFCSNMTCVRKCCPPRTALSHGSMCAPVEEGEGWEPSLASDEPGAAATSVHMLYGPPRFCEEALNYDQFSIQPSGTVKLDELVAHVDAYCIDSFQHSSQAVALVCLDRVAPAWYCEWKQVVLKPVLLGMSSVCLIITWLVYVSVARLRSLNEGRCLISLVTALFVAYVTLIILNLTASEDPSTGCVVAGRLCHLALLASYFWMNVLSFHTFMQLLSQMDDKWEQPLVFRLYSLYAWGCPLVVMVVGLVLDAMQADAIRPHIDFFCWFFDQPAFLAYLYGPMLVLLLVNVGFFVGCVVLLLCCRRRVSFSPSSGQHQTCSAWLYVRLFIIMGILWLTEVVSWNFLSFCSILEFIFDSINCLQGVYVFLVTVCCRRDLKVFHCGRPKLIQKGRHGEVTSTTEDGAEMASNPLVA